MARAAADCALQYIFVCMICALIIPCAGKRKPSWLSTVVVHLICNQNLAFLIENLSIPNSPVFVDLFSLSIAFWSHR